MGKKQNTHPILNSTQNPQSLELQHEIMILLLSLNNFSPFSNDFFSPTVWILWMMEWERRKIIKIPTLELKGSETVYKQRKWNWEKRID